MNIVKTLFKKNESSCCHIKIKEVEEEHKQKNESKTSCCK